LPAVARASCPRSGGGCPRDSRRGRRRCKITGPR